MRNETKRSDHLCEPNRTVGSYETKRQTSSSWKTKTKRNEPTPSCNKHSKRPRQQLWICATGTPQNKAHRFPKVRFPSHSKHFPLGISQSSTQQKSCDESPWTHLSMILNPHSFPYGFNSSPHHVVNLTGSPPKNTCVCCSWQHVAFITPKTKD